jgi:hypothetical protein
LRAAALDRGLEAKRRFMGARLLLRHDKARRTTQTPRRPNGAGGARGANRSGSASMTSIHAPFTTEAECKMAPFTQVRISGFMPLTLARAAIGYHAARTRRVSATGLAPPYGQVATQIQSGSPQPDSAVRILCPASQCGLCGTVRLSTHCSPAGPSLAPAELFRWGAVKPIRPLAVRVDP